MLPAGDTEEVLHVANSLLVLALSTEPGYRRGHRDGIRDGTCSPPGTSRMGPSMGDVVREYTWFAALLLELKGGLCARGGVLYSGATRAVLGYALGICEGSRRAALADGDA